MKNYRKFYTVLSVVFLLIIFTFSKKKFGDSPDDDGDSTKPSAVIGKTQELSERGGRPSAERGRKIDDSTQSSAAARGDDSPPMVHPIMEDLKRFPESFAEAIRAQDFAYAGDLLNGKACVNAPKDMATDPDCLPLLRAEIARDERLFMSDVLAESYLELEISPELKKKSLDSIRRVNPDVYAQRAPCLDYDATDAPSEKNSLIVTCLQKLTDQLEEVGEGPLKSYFWKHFEYLGTQSQDVNRFKTDMEEKFPGISAVPQHTP